ncbi:endonuclease/exonuclease/phosphatase family protein [Ancylostoma duodenale]|uniref:Endonuclease/exonuclease/phosphatase family protein n=1 Tax=Ancylostoma duodenale TaxID=51022 RepID=A0A0C2DCI0_9BILA|nr:endonuclease/exonuclease/phosphatase family protein [Ancylostoma duodenale]
MKQPRRRQKVMTPKRFLKIATWNIRTGHHVGQKEAVIRDLLRYGISIAILSELRLTGSGRLRVASPNNNDEWMMLYYSRGGGEQQTEGVGFALDRKTCDSVIAFQPVSSIIAVLTLGGTIRTHIVAVYAPMEITADSSKDQFYSQLQQVIDSLPHSEFIIVAGDTNAHVGSRREGWEETLGHFGHGEMNDNSLRLLTFAASKSLLIGNSYFQHPRKHKLTWRCPRGTDSAVLNYFLIPSRIRSSFQDIRLMRGANCGSDHQLVVVKVKLRRKSNKRISAPVSCRDWSRLADPICKQQIELELRNRFETLKEPENADEAAEQFASFTVDCASAFCSIMRRRTQAWISNECLDMMDQRKKCKCTNRHDISRCRELHHASSTIVGYQKRLHRLLQISSARAN